MYNTGIQAHVKILALVSVNDDCMKDNLFTVEYENDPVNNHD